jgi:hypothetical protein
LRALDPTALPPKAPKMGPNARKGGGAGSNIDMNDPKIQEILRKLQQQKSQGPAGPPGSPPVPPGPPPGAPQ